MNFSEMINGKEKVFYQLVSFFVVVLIFVLNVFVKLPGFFYYVLLLAAIANIVLGVMNKKGNVFLNILLLGISAVSSVAILGYFSILIGTIIAVPYFVIFVIRFFRK